MIFPIKKNDRIRDFPAYPTDESIVLPWKPPTPFILANRSRPAHERIIKGQKNLTRPWKPTNALTLQYRSRPVQQRIKSHKNVKRPCLLIPYCIKL